jgi:uncharacterized protein
VIARARAWLGGWFARTRKAAASSDHREAGWDLARAFAIVMMVLINFQLMLASRPPATGLDHGEQVLRWLVHVPSGRSSSLFVVLSGVGFSLLTRRARVRTGDATRDRTELVVALRTMLLRVAFLFVLGNTLLLVWPIDILHFYAFYLLLATLLFLRTPGWLVLAIGALATIAAAVIDVALPERAEVPYLTPLGMALDVVVDGVHPVLPWLGFVAWGAWLGRRDLSDVSRRRAYLLRASVVVVLTELASLLLAWTVLNVPALALVTPHLGILNTGWDPAPLFVVSACGTATVFITLAHEITAHPRLGASLPVRALVHTGQLALSIYLTHAIVGVVLPRFFLGWGHALSVGAVTAYWLAFVLTVILGSAIYRRVLPRGPLEWVMRTLTSWRLKRERAGEPPARADESERAADRATPRAKGVWIAVAVGAAALVFARVLGTGGGTDEEVVVLDAASVRGGELTLLHPRHVIHLEVPRLTRVVVETRSGMDLYLELDRIDGTTRRRMAEDDDGGDGLDARIETHLMSGTHELVVRPYGAVTGPFVVTITPAQ